MRNLISLSLIIGICFNGIGQSSKLVGGGCDGCEIMYEGMPKVINETDTTVAWKKNDARMIITGTVYQSNGKVVAPGTIIYYYHTNRQGLYAPSKGQVYGKRSGELRGWVKTDKKGQYKIYTCVPGAYPNEKIPAHVHMFIKEPSINEYYIDDIHFDDDPFLTTSERKRNESRGGSGVMMTDKKNGITYAERNITLGLHIPNYPYAEKTQIASGLSVGENCPAFEPLHISGPDEGTTRCPMCSYGSGQGVMIWWNDNYLSSLSSLLKKFEPVVAKHGIKNLRVFVMYMNPDRKPVESIKKELIAFAVKLALKNVALTLVPSAKDPETSGLYEINAGVKNTILIYRKRKVIDKFVNYEEKDGVNALLNRLTL